MNTSSSDNGGSSFATLAREKANRFRSMGAFGKPAYQNHVQLRAMLRAKRGESAANYLSIPHYDPDAGELRWVATVPGKARRWSELTEDEQGRAALDLEVIRSGLLGFIQEMRTQGGNQSGGAAAFATLLEQAMKVPADGDFMYFVGRQPMIAFWGFEDGQGHSVDPIEKAPRYIASIGSGGFPGVEETNSGAGVNGAAALLTPERPWWRKWWWALLLVLLLLLLLLGLRACGPDEPVTDGAFGGHSAASGPEGAESQPADARPPEPLRRGDGGAAGTNGAAGTAGGAGSSSSGSSTAGDGSSTDAPAGAPPAADSGDAPVPDPSKSSPDQAGKDGGLPPDARSPDKDPAKDQGADPKKDASKDTDNKNKAEEGKPLAIPKNSQDAKKMDFLEGDWKAGDGLADKATGKPVDMGIEFDKNGKGTATLKREDGTRCSGPVQGAMNGGKLKIAGSSPMTCSGGGSYPPPNIECSIDAKGRSPCQGVNPDGSRYSMDMTHK